MTDNPYKKIDPRLPIGATHIQHPKRCWKCDEYVLIGEGFVFKHSRSSPWWDAEHFECPERDGMNEDDWY